MERRWAVLCDSLSLATRDLTPLFILILTCIGCTEPHRPAGEEDRRALEAQAQGKACAFRSSSLSENRQLGDSRGRGLYMHAPSTIAEQPKCFIQDSLLTFFDPGELGCRRHALDCLARLPDSSRSIPTLQRVAASPLPDHDWAGVQQEDVYATLAFALGTTGDERAAPVLASMLEIRESRQSVVDAAFDALGKLGTKTQEAVLNQILATPLKTSRERDAVLTAIGLVGKLQTVPQTLCQSLVELTRASSLSIVEKSYEALGASCRSDTTALAQAYDDASASVALRRRIAVEFFGRIFTGKGAGCPNPVPLLLRQLRNDSAPSVRKAASAALQQIGIPVGAADNSPPLQDETSSRRNRALQEITAKALRIGTLGAHFTGHDTQGEIHGTFLSTARGHHRIEKSRPPDSGTRHEIASYVGNDAWTIVTDSGPNRRSPRDISRFITTDPASPPFTPLLIVQTNKDGSVDLDSIATFDGQGWLTDYSFLGEERIHDESCYLFEYQSELERKKRWISVRLGVLCKEETYFFGGEDTIVDNPTPHQLIEYSDFELNVPAALAEIIVQPEPGEIVHEHRLIEGSTSDREFVWPG
jgi:hypothetical protein